MRSMRASLDNPLVAGQRPTAQLARAAARKVVVEVDLDLHGQARRRRLMP
jgi:hypothetical protein